MGRGGIEPPTFRFSGGRSYRLSYLPQDLAAGSDPGLALSTGLEPATSALTGRRALQLLHESLTNRAILPAPRRVGPGAPGTAESLETADPADTVSPSRR